MNFASRCAISVLVFLIAPYALARGAATLVADEAMLAQPTRNGASVVNLKAGMRVDIIEQKPGWVLVEAVGLQGWVRRIALRVQPGDAGPQYQDTVFQRAAPVLVAGIRKVDELPPPQLKVVSASILCDLPGDCEPPLKQLDVGTQVSLLSQENGWVLVDVGQPARLGWLPVASVCLTTSARTDASSPPMHACVDNPR